MTKKVICPSCGGDGLGDYPYPCDRCGGDKTVWADDAEQEAELVDKLQKEYRHDLAHLAEYKDARMYYCENCGGLFMLRGEEIVFFHSHRGSLSEEKRCHDDVPRDFSLREKLEGIK